MMLHNDIEGYIALKPRYYRFLKAININRNISNEKCSKYNIDLILSKCSGEENEDLQLRCINAFDIKLGRIEGMLGLLVDIEDVRSRQIEGGIYHVVELEEQAFAFFCEEFFVELIS